MRIVMIINFDIKYTYNEGQDKQANPLHGIKQEAEDGISDGRPAQLLHLSQSNRPKELRWMPHTTPLHLQCARHQLRLRIPKMRGTPTPIQVRI
jgi:hypothetical protein